jgi:hypothetical protein
MTTACSRKAQIDTMTAASTLFNNRNNNPARWKKTPAAVLKRKIDKFDAKRNNRLTYLMKENGNVSQETLNWIRWRKRWWHWKGKNNRFGGKINKKTHIFDKGESAAACRAMCNLFWYENGSRNSIRKEGSSSSTCRYGATRYDEKSSSGSTKNKINSIDGKWTENLRIWSRKESVGTCQQDRNLNDREKRASAHANNVATRSDERSSSGSTENRIW